MRKKGTLCFIAVYYQPTTEHAVNKAECPLFFSRASLSKGALPMTHCIAERRVPRQVAVHVAAWIGATRYSINLDELYCKWYPFIAEASNINSSFQRTAFGSR